MPSAKALCVAKIFFLADIGIPIALYICRIQKVNFGMEFVVWHNFGSPLYIGILGSKTQRRIGKSYRQGETQRWRNERFTNFSVGGGGSLLKDICYLQWKPWEKPHALRREKQKCIFFSAFRRRIIARVSGRGGGVEGMERGRRGSAEQRYLSQLVKSSRRRAYHSSVHRPAYLETILCDQRTVCERERLYRWLKKTLDLLDFQTLKMIIFLSLNQMLVQHTILT